MLEVQAMYSINMGLNGSNVWASLSFISLLLLCHSNICIFNLIYLFSFFNAIILSYKIPVSVFKILKYFFNKTLMMLILISYYKSIIITLCNCWPDCSSYTVNRFSIFDLSIKIF